MISSSYEISLWNSEGSVQPLESYASGLLGPIWGVEVLLDIGIRYSFLLNLILIYLITIYSSYEISLQIFERIRAAVGKLYFIGGWTMAGYWIQVQFFAQFYYCISHYSLFQLRNKPMNFQKDSHSRWKVIFYWGGGGMVGYRNQAQFVAQFFLLHQENSSLLKLT